MRNWKTYILLALAMALAVLAVVTWGSLGSAVCIYCLITMVSGLLFKRFLVNRDADDYKMED